MKYNSIKISSVYAHNKIKAGYFLSDGVVAEEKVRKLPHENLIDTLDYCSNIGGVNKRIYVTPENGLPLVSMSDLTKYDPKGICKFISKKIGTTTLKHLFKDQMIISAVVGGVGDTVIVNKASEGCITGNNLIKLFSKREKYNGFLYAYLKSKYGNKIIKKLSGGAVQSYIDPELFKLIPVPIYPKDKQFSIHDLIIDASNLRVRGVKLLKKTQSLLKELAGLKDLKAEDYEYFGAHKSGRPTSTFKRNINEISPVSINAFNYSKRVEKLEERITKNNYLPLSKCLDEKQFFSTGSFKRVEIDSKSSIKLINQSDIFNIDKKGKQLARKFVKGAKLVEYGEVVIAGVGSLGESETFCRTLFANEELEGELISGEFIRMNTNENVLPGYLYAFLSSDYGFRFIRKIQSGTKLCRPIPELLKRIPIPILDPSQMKKIDADVKKAHTMLYDALLLEKKAIALFEEEMESWQG